jgi:acetyl esterase/lipase
MMMWQHSWIAMCVSVSLAAAVYQIEANIRYAPYPETVLDILQPRAPALKNRSAAIVIHGGGWVEGDKESMVDEFCLPFLQQNFVVANVEYRLAKAATAPAAVTDVLTAAKWLHDHAAEYKVDPAQIIAVGNSAGGHLALLAAMAPASAGLGPSSKIAAAIDFYGIADVADQLEGSNQREYAVAWIPEQPRRMELARSLSPQTYVRKGLPPILALHGDRDDVVPYEQSVKLTKALKSAGDDATLLTVPGGQHGFAPEEMNKLWPQVFKWLKRHKIGADSR